MRAALIWLVALPALAEDVSCPGVLPRDAIEVHAPAGWKGYSSGIMRLTGYGMMAGPPESMADLVPAREKKAKGRTATTWRFAAGSEKWLYCTYDGSSAIQISKRLDDAATECELSHTRDAFGSIAEMVAACRQGTGR